MQKSSPLRRILLSVLFLLGNGAIKPLLLLLGATVLRVRQDEPSPRINITEVFVSAAALCLIFLYVLVYTRSPFLSDLIGSSANSLSGVFIQVFGGTRGSASTMTALTGISALLVIVLLSVHQTRLRQTVITLAMATFLGLSCFARFGSAPVLDGVFSRFTHFNLSLEAVASHFQKKRRSQMKGLIEVARFAQQESPTDAIFLTPPNFGAFRIFAERAIIVDFKSVPLQSPGAWFDRIEDLYGPVKEEGVMRIKHQLNRDFGFINDIRINSVGDKYGATFAVLFKNTRTHYPVLFRGSVYKIIAIN